MAKTDNIRVKWNRISSDPVLLQSFTSVLETTIGKGLNGFLSAPVKRIDLSFDYPFLYLMADSLYLNLNLKAILTIAPKKESPLFQWISKPNPALIKNIQSSLKQALTVLEIKSSDIFSNAFDISLKRDISALKQTWQEFIFIEKAGRLSIYSADFPKLLLKDLDLVREKQLQLEKYQNSQKLGFLTNPVREADNCSKKFLEACVNADFLYQKHKIKCSLKEARTMLDQPAVLENLDYLKNMDVEIRNLLPADIAGQRPVRLSDTVMIELNLKDTNHLIGLKTVLASARFNKKGEPIRKTLKKYQDLKFLYGHPDRKEAEEFVLNLIQTSPADIERLAGPGFLDGDGKFYFSLKDGNQFALGEFVLKTAGFQQNLDAWKEAVTEFIKAGNETLKNELEQKRLYLQQSVCEDIDSNLAEDIVSLLHDIRSCSLNTLCKVFSGAHYTGKFWGDEKYRGKYNEIYSARQIEEQCDRLEEKGIVRYQSDLYHGNRFIKICSTSKLEKYYDYLQAAALPAAEILIEKRKSTGRPLSLLETRSVLQHYAKEENQSLMAVQDYMTAADAFRFPDLLEEGKALLRFLFGQAPYVVHYFLETKFPDNYKSLELTIPENPFPVCTGVSE